MRVLLGYDDYKRKHQSQDVPVYWDPASIINPHVLVCGKSGTGKSTRLKQMIAEAVATAGDEFERYHNLDVHGDLVIEGESRVRFDGETRYGYNPLVSGYRSENGRRKPSNQLFDLNDQQDVSQIDGPPRGDTTESSDGPLRLLWDS
ncbi:helicase HerA domain-containing protein [Cupriavidus basilensis]